MIIRGEVTKQVDEDNVRKKEGSWSQKFKGILHWNNQIHLNELDWYQRVLQ